MLIVLKQTCDLLGITDATIEIVPPEEGGLKDLYKIIVKKSKKYAMLALVAFGSYWTWRQAVSQIEVNELDKQLKKLELKQKLKEIEQDSLSKAREAKLRNEIIQIAVDTLSKDYKASSHRSHFYERTIKTTAMVEKISTQIFDDNKKPMDKERIAIRSTFKEFILQSNSIAPIIDDQATIKIIAPIVDGGDYSWKGWYKGEEVNFKMNDLKFRQDILFEKVSFTGGSTIECVLQIKQKLEEKIGQIKKEKYIVLRIHSHIHKNGIRTDFEHKRKLKHELPKPGAQLDFFRKTSGKI